MTSHYASRLALALMLFVAIGQPARADTVEEKAQVCTACHGENGIPIEPDFPIIWGQNEGYIYIELKDFKSGLRKSDQMNVVAADLSRDDMKALAAYFSKKPWPTVQYAAKPADVNTGRRVATAGMCTECHLGGFIGSSVIPRISGQNVAYLEKTIVDIKTGKRANNPAMTALLVSFSEDDLKAMARYLAGIHVQK